MWHKDSFNAVKPVVHGTFTPRTAAKRYNVPNGNILQVETRLEFLQEQLDTPLVKYYNQKQIFRWVRNYINLPSVQGQGSTEWELHEACKK